MLLTKRAYVDFTGKEIPQKDVLLYQARQSFKPGEITPEQAQQTGYGTAFGHLWIRSKNASQGDVFFEGAILAYAYTGP